jgi:AbiV family abortive infection protein
MNTDSSMSKDSLSFAMRACVENGQRLCEDADWLGSDHSATAVVLFILAQEEFAKAFMLYLVSEGIIPWNTKVRESLRSHKHKQLIGIIMEWLSPTDDDFITRGTMRSWENPLPVPVADAVKLYVEKVLPQGHISCPPTASDPVAISVANGDRDKTKQDAIYVRLSEDGEVLSVPSAITPEMVKAELGRTRRISDLVRPLREGELGPVLNYELFVETMNFLLLDKRNRPFLIVKESEFGGPVTSSGGSIWPHSIAVLIENITGEQATCTSGHATVFLDNEVVKPSFFFNQFSIEPHVTNRSTFFISEETYATGTSPSHKLALYIKLEYLGHHSDHKYNARLWSTYDPITRRFKESFSDLQVSVSGASSEETETKFRTPRKTVRNPP